MNKLESHFVLIVLLMNVSAFSQPMINNPLSKPVKLNTDTILNQTINSRKWEYALIVIHELDQKEQIKTRIIKYDYKEVINNIKVDSVESGITGGCFDGIGYSTRLLLVNKEATLHINFTCEDYATGEIGNNLTGISLHFNKKTSDWIKQSIKSKKSISKSKKP